MKLYSSAQIKKMFGYSNGTSISDVSYQVKEQIKKVGWDRWVLKDEPVTKFSDLALGARFTYQGESTIWVKISPTTVAQWIENMKDCRWMGQPVCSFDENDDTSLPVNVL